MFCSQAGNIIRMGGDLLMTQVKSALAEEVIKIDHTKRRVIAIYSSAREERLLVTCALT